MHRWPSGTVRYRCSDGSDLYWLQLPAPPTCRTSGDMEGNTTAIPTLFQLTQSGSVWLLCAGHSKCLVTNPWRSAQGCRCSTWASRRVRVRGSHCSVVTYTCLHRVMSHVTLEFSGKTYIGVMSDQHQPNGSKYCILYKKEGGGRGRVKAIALGSSCLA